MRYVSRYFWSILWTLLTLAAFITLLVVNETAREVTGGTLRAILGLVSTPFIFETTCIFVFIVALLTYNQWKMHKDGDDWVYLVSEDPEDPALPKSVTQRLQSVVLQDKPEAADPALTLASIVEGYLELGMAAQAQAELEAQHPLPDTAETAVLNSRVQATAPDTTEATAFLEASVSRFPEARSLFVQCALENARWLLKHLHHEQAATAWVQEAESLAQGGHLLFHADDPLRKLS